MLLGVLGRAQRLHPVEICGFSFVSNHYHMLLWVPDAERMAEFMGYFQTNAAREVARLRKWKDKVWSRRYEAIVVSDEPAAQVDRLRYVLANGVKEGLVARVEEWPGISMVKAVLYGEPIRGTWFNRTEEYRARL
ncbi:MAG TPA: transposase, partial [Thermoanaerobaculia bacterium]|nr:transposase [Thermoanaerobaculia bacterium]